MVSGKLIFISGGVRSGKSAYAEKLLVEEHEAVGGRLVYIASGTATDSEMQERIQRHQADRAAFNWTTIEQPTDLEAVLLSIQQGDLVLWDCLTTWLANELYVGWEIDTPCITQPNCMERKVAALYQTIEAIVAKVGQLVIVSNEVLDDLSPVDVETETYRKWLGEIHQNIVAMAYTAIEMESGMPMFWKGGEVI